MLVSSRYTSFNSSRLAGLVRSSQRLVSSHRSRSRKLGRVVNMSTSNGANSAFVAAIDQGTSSSRVILYNAAGESIATHQVPLELLTPSPGWVEQRPQDIIDTVKTCMQGVLENAKEAGFTVSSENLKAVGITNQRETTVVWNKKTGKPLYNTIVWSDARTDKLVLQLTEKYKSQGGADRFRDATGLPISTYFSALKLKWMIENLPEVSNAIKSGDALFGTVDTWLLWNLTGGVNGGVHLTDVTNASRTLLLNLETLEWDEEVAKELEIPLSVLPSVRSSAERYGKISLEDVPAPFKNVSISGCLGDQQAALVGQQCLSRGLAKSTYGTGCFVLYNTGEERVASKHGLLTTVGYKLGPDAPVNYALEGSISTAGSGIDWFKTTFGMGDASTKEALKEALAVQDSGGVVFVPAFNGLLAPHWRPDARGTIVGLSFATERGHILRALIDAIAHQGRDVLHSMELDSGVQLESVKVDGGLARSELLMQVQADTLGATVQRPSDIETTARGAAYAAGLAEGIFSGADHPILAQDLTLFTPKIDSKLRIHNKTVWEKAVQRSLDWTHEIEMAEK